MSEWMMENPETHRGALGREINDISKLVLYLVDSDS